LITGRKILAAKSHADWLGLWFSQNAPPADAATTEGEMPFLHWRIVKDEEPPAAGKPLAAKDRGEAGEMGIGLPALDESTMKKLRVALSWEYKFAPATQRAAKSSVTALRRQAEETDDEAEQFLAFKKFARSARGAPQAARRATRLSAAEIGLAHHKFLQFIALDKTGEPGALEAESRRLESEKILSADERAVLNLASLADFWNSEIGKKIRDRSACVKRELPFTARFSPAELAEIIGAKPDPKLEGEFIVVQGVADLAVLLPGEIWLLDFKTDDISAEELPGKIRTYAPQLKLYAGALAKIFSRPVTACWLHFLSLRRSERIG